jgi:Concanavalin A-like lectin/glucanases superfamily
MPFLTPNEISPLIEMRMTLPEEFIPHVSGAIFEMSLVERWEQEGLLTPSQAAAAMATAFHTRTFSETFPPLLQNSLAAYWTLNETSGSRLDSQSRHYDLTDVGGVLSVAGKMGNAAGFTASPQRSLTLADNDLTRIGNRSFTIAGWVRFNTSGLSTQQGIWGKYKIAVDGNRDFFLQKLSTNFLEWNLSADGTLFTPVPASLFGVVAGNIWYFVTCRYDHENELASISVNEKLNAAGHSTGVHIGNSPFYVGRNASQFLGGNVDALAFFNHAITRSQENWLYNSGNGRLYAEIMAYSG